MNQSYPQTLNADQPVRVSNKPESPIIRQQHSISFSCRMALLKYLLSSAHDEGVRYRLFARANYFAHGLEFEPLILGISQESIHYIDEKVSKFIFSSSCPTWQDCFQQTVFPSEIPRFHKNHRNIPPVCPLLTMNSVIGPIYSGQKIKRKIYEGTPVKVKPNAFFLSSRFLNLQFQHSIRDIVSCRHSQIPSSIVLQTRFVVGQFPTTPT